MMKPHTMTLVLAALLMLMFSCQQPGTKEKGAAAKAGYNPRTVQTKLNNNRGKDPIFEINPALFNAALDDEYVDIPDPVFLDSLINGGVDQNKDGKISIAEAEAIGYCYIPNVKGLVSMEGLQAFKNIQKLLIDKASDLEILPLDLPILNILTLTGTNIKTISFDKTPKLTYLGLVDNKRMSDLNFEPLKSSLISLIMYDMPEITRLDFRTFTQIISLIVYNMDNLLTFEIPERYESTMDNGSLYLATSPAIETLDMHLLPTATLSIDIYENASLKKVYVTAEQRDKFTTAGSDNPWKIDNLNLLEVVS